MKSKRIQFTILWLFSVFICKSFAEDNRKIIEAKLNDATVFFQGAELTHTASIALNKGDNEIQVEGLSPNIDINSLKIKASNGVLVSSFEFSVDVLSGIKNTPNPKIKSYQDSIDYYQKKITLIDTDLKVNGELMDILKKSTEKNISGSEKGIPIEELIQTMDYYRGKQTELENAQKQLNIDRKLYNTSIERLSGELSKEMVKNNKSVGILKITLSAPLTVTANFTISYYTPSASWMPYYDITAVSIDKPIQIVGKAKVRQITGLDWNKVKLTLSSAIPSHGKVAPLFSTWFLQQQRAIYSDMVSGMAVQNAYSYAPRAKKSEKVSAVKELKDMDTKTEDNEPIYIVDGTPVDAFYFSALDPEMIKTTTYLTGDEAIQRYGKGAAVGVHVIELKSSMDDYVSQAENELNTVFNIDIPYTIPGNGKEQSLTLLTKEASAEYQYYCAPKLDQQTYLLAEIPDWQKLGLLSGKGNVSYDGTYVGETFIDANSTLKKLGLTLGADKRVVVKREKLKEFSSTKFLGSDVKQEFTYKITVRNNQNKKVRMVLKEQYPQSNEKSIQVEFLEKQTTPFSAHNKEVGVITWEEELEPGQVKEYRFSYSVKYPKGANLNL